MTALESWLKQATRRLSKDSAAQVRTEIQEHYESAREAAMSRGVAADEADRLAVTALGDAKTANCQYRKVLLTSDEARMLREANWEVGAVCSHSWLKWMFLALPVAALVAATILFLNGKILIARGMLAAAIATGFFFAAPFLPIYTPSRGRVYRGVKWVVLVGTFALALGPEALKSFWLLTSTLWVVGWIEWKRVSIRRKLPVAKWPKQMYL